MCDPNWVSPEFRLMKEQVAEIDRLASQVKFYGFVVEPDYSRGDAEIERLQRTLEELWARQSFEENGIPGRDYTILERWA